MRKRINQMSTPIKNRNKIIKSLELNLTLNPIKNTNRMLSAHSKFWGLSWSEDSSGGDNSIQFINFGRVGDKNFK